ncbi:MAG: NUDIX domain-containing protein [Candidatus Paceibacterota bacterium]
MVGTLSGPECPSALAGRSYSSVALIFLPRQLLFVMVHDDPEKRGTVYRKLPGGNVDPCDKNDPFKTVIREVAEETGIVDPDTVTFRSKEDKGDYDRYLFLVVKHYSGEEWKQNPLKKVGDEGEIVVTCPVENFFSRVDGLPDLLPNHDDLLYRVGVKKEIQDTLKKSA